MLSNAPFYWGSVRKVVESFGVVFSDLHIVRYKADGTPYQTIEVPCEYGPKEKWFVRNTQNPMPGTDDQVEMVLPRMSYEIMGWQYDAVRKLTSTGRTVQALTDNNTVLKAQFNPVPYNFTFTLHIGAKNVEDGLMIVEQILPFFGPEYTIAVNDMPELNLEKDVVIVHDGAVTQEDNWEGSFDRRLITWSLNFTVKAYLYPPVKLNKINLETDIYYRVDGGTNAPGDAVPFSETVPDPLNASAVDVTRVSTSFQNNTILVVPSPTSATIAGGSSQTFNVNIVNTTDITFTLNVPVTATTTEDSVEVDLVHGTFTYNCGTGVRTAQEILQIDVISGADQRRKAIVVLILNP